MITIYDWFGYELPIKERYQLIKDAGFDGVLLWWSDGFGRDGFGRGDYRNGPQMARAGSYAQHGLPFDGTIDWSITMKKIAETGYSGATAVEAMNWDYENLSAEEFLRKAFEQAKRLEALRL